MTITRTFSNYLIAKRVGAHAGMSLDAMRKVEAFIIGVVITLVILSVARYFGFDTDVRMFLGDTAAVYSVWILTVAVLRMRAMACSAQLMRVGVVSGVISVLALSALTAFATDSSTLTAGHYINGVFALVFSHEYTLLIIGVLFGLFIPGWFWNINPIGLLLLLLGELTSGTDATSRADRLGARKGKGKVTKQKMPRLTKELRRIVQIINNKNPLVTDAWHADSPVLDMVVFKLQDETDPNAVKKNIGKISTVLGYDSRAVEFIQDYSPGCVAMGFPKKERSPIAPEDVSEYGKINWLVGYDQLGEKFVIDLMQRVHMLVPGTTGSGKTSTMYSMIDAIANSDVESDMFFIDPKETGFVPFKKKGYYATDLAGANAALQKLYTLMLERNSELANSSFLNIHEYNEANAEKWAHQFLFMDELLTLTNPAVYSREDIDRMFGLLDELLRMARTVGIHVIVGLQSVTKTALNDARRGLFTAVLLHKVQTAAESARASGVAQLGGNKLTGNGDMRVILEDGSTFRVQATYADPRKVAKRL